MKKYLMLFLLVSIVFSMASCGGGGAGSSSSPPGGDPNVAFYVKLRPSHIVAQTNTFIYFHARVINREGNPIPNIPVYFTNISPIGTFDVNPPVVNTDQYGYATVKLLSPTEGFATVQAEVNTGSGQVRERRTVFFSVSMNLTPFMYLDVDGDDDGIYDEDSDYILFENSTDNQVLIRATVFNRFGQRAFGSVVTFGADWPYKIGSSTTCSDGSSACEVTFPNGNTATTNSSGEAFVLVRVDPITIKNVTTILNITASADNGAANMVTLELLPVTIDTVTVSADPSVVEPEGTSTITAAVTLNTGGPAFDGTVVSFTTTCGSVTPFAQTTDGAAEATFTAPSTEDTCTITATAGGQSDTVEVIVTTALTVQPGAQSIVGATGGTRVFTIFGGLEPYTVTSNNPAIACNSTDADCSDSGDTGTWTVDASGDTFTVTVPAGTPSGSVTLTVRDFAGNTKDVTLTIAAAPAITIVPGSYSVSAGAGGAFDFTITGGAPPYIVNSGNPSAVYEAPGDGVWDVAASGDTFTATVSATACPGTTTLTVYDTAGGTKTATIVIVANPIIITAIPSTNICEDNDGCLLGLLETVGITITGGVPPYFTTSGNSAVIPSLGPGASFPAVEATDASILADTTVVLTTTDSCAATKQTSITVIDE
jgi:hypothetical protein